jgi:hypothetical protein
MRVVKEQCDTHMVDWQVTATTIYCDAVDDEVTIMVYKDWSAKCTGVRKYSESREEQLNLVKKSLRLRRALECEGVQCTRIIEYKQKLRDEEAFNKRSIPTPATTFEEEALTQQPTPDMAAPPEGIEPSTDEQ